MIDINKNSFILDNFDNFNINNLSNTFSLIILDLLFNNNFC